MCLGRTEGACVRRGCVGNVPDDHGSAEGDRERRQRNVRSTRTPPRTVYPVASTDLSHGHSRGLCDKRSHLGDAEGRWGRTDAAAVISKWSACQPLSGPGRSMALNPAAPPAVAS